MLYRSARADYRISVTFVGIQLHDQHATDTVSITCLVSQTRRLRLYDLLRVLDKWGQPQPAMTEPSKDTVRGHVNKNKILKIEK